jgi:hypothetical protein
MPAAAAVQRKERPRNFERRTIRRIHFDGGWHSDADTHTHTPHTTGLALGPGLLACSNSPHSGPHTKVVLVLDAAHKHKHCAYHQCHKLGVLHPQSNSNAVYLKCAVSCVCISAQCRSVRAKKCLGDALARLKALPVSRTCLPREEREAESGGE